MPAMRDGCGAGAEWAALIARVGDRLTRAFEEVLGRLRRERAILEGRPGSGGWSTLEIGDHLVLANHYLLILLRKLRDKGLARAQAGAEIESHAPPLDAIEKLSSRSLRWVHPDHMGPRDAIDPVQTCLMLEQQLDECLSLLASTPKGEGSLHRIRMSVVGEDKLDLYQYTLVVALHIERHVAQIDRNDAS
ncbi:MAG: hypothetical protein ACI841_002680 [Planctomycetota bacterium]|jgi:hypothetical protein